MKLIEPKITRLTTEYDLVVYDLEVKDDHTYCVGDDIMVAHNCSTYNNTGVGSPMFSSVLKCAKSSPIPIIADGGIREVGDICKALVAGATMVMIGSEFVKCIDSPAENVYDVEAIKDVYGKFNCRWNSELDTHLKTKPPGYNSFITHKKYYGSASSKNKGNNKYVEGWDEVILPCNGMKYLDYYQKIHDGVVSCMSYHNLRDVSDMHTIEWSKHTI